MPPEQLLQLIELKGVANSSVFPYWEEKERLKYIEEQLSLIINSLP